MAKRKSGYKPDVKTRESEPRIGNKGKETQVLCPFCNPPHPIAVGQESPCGTALMIKAVQVYYPKRTVNKRGLECLKCHKGGGEMVKFNLGYVHLHECAPGTKLMTEPPEYSRWAAAVHRMPGWMSRGIERYTGHARPVKEVDLHGKETGNVLGYFFWKSPSPGKPNGGSNAPN